MDIKNNPLIAKLFEAGAHFAQQKRRRHPSMKSVLVGSLQKVEIFDLAKTQAQIEKAKEVMRAFAKEGKTVLFVGSKQEIAESVRNAASRASLPFVSTRWLGGTLTNFPEIKKRIDRLATLKAEKESGEHEKKYTKLERLHLEREMTRLSDRLDGITNLSKTPDAFVIVDTRHESHATKEAQALRAPIIGIMSSDCDLADATYPITLNDASKHAVTLVLEELASAYEEGRKGE